MVYTTSHLGFQCVQQIQETTHGKQPIFGKVRCQGALVYTGQTNICYDFAYFGKFIVKEIGLFN